MRLAVAMATLFRDFADLVPTDDWELNVLLLDIAKSLSDEEFSRIKFLCSGKRGIPAGKLERLDTPEKLFIHLKEKGMISRDNLLLLQSFLWHLDRQDLHEKSADYARKVKDTLYFYAPSTKPEAGFEHVQFHVEGNLDRFQRPDLEALRATLARLLFVPQEFIFLQGVEPSGSLTLTFMIHKQCVTPLRHLFGEHRDSFDHFGVDGLFVDGEEYFNLPQMGRRPSMDETNSQKELEDLFQRSMKLEREATETEIRLQETRAEVVLARQDARNWRRRESYIRSLLVRATTDNDSTIDTDLLKEHPSLV